MREASQRRNSKSGVGSPRDSKIDGIVYDNNTMPVASAVAAALYAATAVSAHLARVGCW
jgi:hypothetical protein